MIRIQFEIYDEKKKKKHLFILESHEIDFCPPIFICLP